MKNGGRAKFLHSFEMSHIRTNMAVIQHDMLHYDSHMIQILKVINI